MSSHDHSMNAEVAMKPGVTYEQLVKALEPIRGDIFVVDGEDTEATEGNNSFEVTEKDGFVTLFSIATCGDMNEDYAQRLADMAKNLSSIAYPGIIELRDYDTPELENSIEVIWFGEGEELIGAQKRDAWIECEALMLGAGFSKESVAEAAEVLGMPTTVAPKDKSASPKP